jgi:hypothetical protein
MFNKKYSRNERTSGLNLNFTDFKNKSKNIEEEESKKNSKRNKVKLRDPVNWEGHRQKAREKSGFEKHVPPFWQSAFAHALKLTAATVKIENFSKILLKTMFRRAMNLTCLIGN